MALVQHWWNGQWGWTRCDIKLIQGESAPWELFVRTGREEGYLGYDDEDSARRQMDRWLRESAQEHGYEWRDITRAHQP